MQVAVQGFDAVVRAVARSDPDWLAIYPEVVRFFGVMQRIASEVPKLPARFRQGYEPVFFDATLSFSEKIAQWRIQPAASLQLVTSVIMISVLALGVVSMG